MADAKKATLRVTQTGSPIRRPKDQRATLVGLGLNKMHAAFLRGDDDYFNGYEGRSRITRL